MKLRLLIIGFLAFLGMASARGDAGKHSANVGDFDKTVFPLTELHFIGLGIEGKFGTGFCLDPECRFIGTNYHVAVMSHPRKIKGQKVLARYLATSPEDEGATLNDGFGVAPTKYALSRDLAIFELRHSLTNHQGIPFSLSDLRIGQDVDIYAFPKEGVSPLRRLLQFHGSFAGENQNGLLAFHYSLSDGKAIRPGASGGIVVDSGTRKVVGILNSIAKNGELVAMAVPIRDLADFVNKIQPRLAQRLFPSLSAVPARTADLYPRLHPPPPTNTLRHRPDEPVEVKVLRIKAQALADGMRDFIAVQSFEWGSENNQPAALSKYEVRVIHGYQRFREYPDGEKELKEVPWPPLSNAIAPGDAWSLLPEVIGTEFGLRIQQAGSVVVNGRQIKVFQYRADPEDDACRFKSVTDFGFFATNKIGSVGCYGEVWTDEDTDILRMSEHFILPGRWKDYETVVTYGWLQRNAEVRKLIPLTFDTQAKINTKVYWCRGQFTDYKTFGSKVKILTENLQPEKPQ